MKVSLIAATIAAVSGFLFLGGLRATRLTIRHAVTVGTVLAIDKENHGGMMKISYSVNGVSHQNVFWPAVRQ